MKKENVHFVGIGGSGMSALAGFYKKQGREVTGSDMQSGVAALLKKDGVRVFSGHTAKNLGKATRVIHSFAVPANNPELTEAKRRGIKIQSYPEAAGELTKSHSAICVCGTHGKSTITSLISKVLIENAFDPSVIVGANLRELGGKNFRVGKNKLLVLEACEYRRAFLNYFPRIILLHTLDPDHLDYYRDFEDYLSAFRAFAERLPPDGYFFANLDDPDVHGILRHLQLKKFPSYNMFTYSSKYPQCDFYLHGKKIMRSNEEVGELRLKIPGEHNRTNALAAFAVCATLGIAPAEILRSLNRYSGAHRRFERKGKVGKTELIDDYAHHPAEIRATLQAAREAFQNKKICVVFQPHQYSRTKKLFKEFGEAFGDADFVIIPNIYEVRDSVKDKKGVSAEKLVVEIQRHKPKGTVLYGKGEAATVAYLKKHLSKFGAIITMGAGDVCKIADALQSSSSSSPS